MLISNSVSTHPETYFTRRNTLHSWCSHTERTFLESYLMRFTRIWKSGQEISWSGQEGYKLKSIKKKYIYWEEQWKIIANGDQLVCHGRIKCLEKWFFWWARVPFENVRAIDNLLILKFAPMFRRLKDSLMTVHTSPRCPWTLVKCFWCGRTG